MLRSLLSRPWLLTVMAVQAAAFVLAPELMAGAIGWADMAADASGSMQALGAEAVPLVVGAGVMSAALHLPGMTTALLATGGATYVAANADQVQGIIGGGGGGGFITDIVIPAGHTTLSLLI